MRATLNEDRYTKLPKWAQIELANLTKRTLAAEAEVRRVIGAPGESNVSISSDEGRVNLPLNSRVTFSLETGETVTVWHDYDRKGKFLGLKMWGNPDLAVRGTNVFQICPKREQG